MTHTIIDSPIGTLTLVRGDEGLTGIFMPDHRPVPDETAFGDRDDAAFADAAQQLAEYWAGERTAFDLPLAPVGTPFQQRVWQALREIPYGETRTYGWIAERIGQPTAVRAVGLANGRNPCSIVVPCHRVVGSSGALTGYAGGVERKRFLLDLERGDGLAGAGLDSVA
ncbi:methylated-DNA--[protein]-cysteine S-methyltransferase [Agrococcus sediminis]|uniref:methylated-DNA--[protein]-cysteine S-methyltransferase n=1 Tax=Agrococcus sediminis TaxID=2599924 RepID=UPI003819603F